MNTCIQRPKWTLRLLIAPVLLSSAAHAFAPALSVDNLNAFRTEGACLSQHNRFRLGLGSARTHLKMQAQDEAPDGLERFVACLPHVVPLANSVALGYNVFKTLPLLTIPYLPLRPLYELFRNVPAVSFGAVVLLLLLSTKPVGIEPRFLDLSSRLVRYNILQVRTVAAMQCSSSPQFRTLYWSDEAHSSEGPSLLRPKPPRNTRVAERYPIDCISQCDGGVLHFHTFMEKMHNPMTFNTQVHSCILCIR